MNESRGSIIFLFLVNLAALRAGGVLQGEKLTLRKNRSCQRLHRNWRFRDHRIFW